jgi:5-methylcytosine-specific restriction endonuclease McrA
MPRISAKEKLRQFFRTRVGEVVTSAELQEAAGPVTEWARRVRELRNDEGWPIESHNDRTDLVPGQYILVSSPPESDRYRFSKPISNRLRAQVLERNGYTCKMCGVAAGDQMENGRIARLHVGHIVDKSHGGPDTLDNLRALCSQCNQGAKNVTQEPPTYVWLLSQIRRATEADQRRALDWLRSKFDRT